MTLRQIDNGSFETMKSFLAENKLPNGDLKLDNNYFFAYYDDGGKMVGTGGLEFYSSHALLRSIAVSETLRGTSVGKKIVSHLIDEADRRNIREIFLLTETAPIFFQKLGFQNVSRETVPEEVKASTEFASVCPVSAVCMSVVLR